MPLEHRLHARCGCASAGAAEHTLASSGRPFAFPTSVRHFERDRPFVIEHLMLDITLDVSGKSIRATATLDVRRVDPSASQLSLDAVGFDAVTVAIDGRTVAAEYDGRFLLVPLPVERTKARIIVGYRATPRRGLYFLQPDEHYPQRPRQVWSQCQEEDARHWVPCHDSPHVKMTTEVIAHVPPGWFALSNGNLVASEKPEGKPATYHYRMPEPHSSYLLTLAAGEFAEMSD